MIEVRAYDAGCEASWDAFCAGACNATFLHTRRFLAYHGDRFQDASLLLLHAGKLVGVLPAALSPADPRVVESHPGATYGGIVHDGWLRGSRMIDAFGAIRRHYGQHGLTTLRYRAVPHIYATLPAQDDLYALFRVGAKCVRRDLSSSVDLQQRGPVSERRRRALRKAGAAVTVGSGAADLPRLWDVIAGNIERKHGAAPVHTLEQMRELVERFPDQIAIRTAHVGGQVEAGVVFFLSAKVWHAQYIAASEVGYAVSALDAVFDAALREATGAGARFLDFGTSNEEQGHVLNEGLYRFKTEFGGGGVVHEHFDIALEQHGG